MRRQGTCGLPAIRPRPGHALAAAALAVSMACGALGCGARDDEAAAPPPSLIVITVDTLRADRLGEYGHRAARTPVLDALARRGVRFEEATTPFPRTTPALGSMLTGLLPWRHGSREVGQPIRDAIATVPAILAARGYTTLGVSVNGAAGSAQNLDRGFERFLDHESFADHTAAGVTDATVALLAEHLLTHGRDGLEAGAAPRSPASPRAQHGAEGPPIFLWVHYIDPHFPYSPPPSWEDQPAGGACHDLVARSGSDLVATAHVRIDLDGAASAALADCSALYDAEIAFTDFQIGRLLAVLEERGLLDPGYVVFTSDHGENLGEDGLFYEHGPSVHDASLRVPLLVAGPGIEPRVDSAVARLEDLAPTLLALARVPERAWPPFDGVDLSPRLFEARAAAASEAAVAESGGALLPETFTYLVSGHPGDLQCVNGSRFSLCTEPNGAPRLYDHVADPFLERDLSGERPDVVAALLAARRRWPPGEARERSLRTARWKLVERPLLAGGWSAALYDLAADPAASRDVAAERPDLVARMRAELAAAFADAPAAAATELEPRELETLRALGYVR